MTSESMGKRSLEEMTAVENDANVVPMVSRFVLFFIKSMFFNVFSLLLLLLSPATFLGRGTLHKRGDCKRFLTHIAQSTVAICQRAWSTAHGRV
jgi:membrane protein required for beta-lactamase induction